VEAAAASAPADPIRAGVLTLLEQCLSAVSRGKDPVD
jgi:hypothetical protein